MLHRINSLMIKCFQRNPTVFQFGGHPAWKHYPCMLVLWWSCTVIHRNAWNWVFTREKLSHRQLVFIKWLLHMLTACTYFSRCKTTKVQVDRCVKVGKSLPNNPDIFGRCDGRWKKSSPILDRYYRTNQPTPTDYITQNTPNTCIHSLTQNYVRTVAGTCRKSLPKSIHVKLIKDV